MPGNEVGDRVHNFFAQDNLSHGQHSQVGDGNWPLNNNSWIASQKQIGVPNSNQRIYSSHQSELERGNSNQRFPVPQGFNFTQTTKPEFAKSQSQSQQPNLNGYMYGQPNFQTSPDEANFLGVDTESDRNYVNQRRFSVYESQQEGFSEQISKHSVRSDTSDTHGSLDLFGGQHQMNNQHPGLLQALQQQQSEFSDIQQLQQQLMFKKMQEIQRQKDLQQLDAKQVNSVNQASLFAAQASSRQSHGFINGYPTSDSSSYPRAEIAAGNTNWLQRASPAMQGSSSGIPFFPEQGQAQRSMGFIHQQVDQSLHGVPISSSMGPLNQYAHGSIDKASNQQMQTYSDSFAGNQYGVVPEQFVMHHGTSVGRQGFPDKSLFGHKYSQDSNSGIRMEHIQQPKFIQQGASMHEFHGPRNQIGPSELVQDKSALEATSSHAAASLDPDEEKILFGSDENIWDAFGSNKNMDGEAFNLLDNSELASELPSLQSGSWSALMQSAVAETSSSGMGLQEEMTGLNFLGPELSSGRRPSTYEGSKEKQMAVGDVNLPNAAALSFGADGTNMNDNSSGQMNQHHSGGTAWSNPETLKRADAEGSTLYQNASNSMGGEMNRKSITGPWSSQQYWTSQPNNKQNNLHMRDTALNISENNNSLQQSQSIVRKRVMDEVGTGDGVWRVNHLHNSNVDLEPVKNSMGSPQINKEGFAASGAAGIPNLSIMQGSNHSSRVHSNSHHLNYWKHVDSPVKSKGGENLGTSQRHLNKGSQFSETSSFNSAEMEDPKMHEMESSSKRENSNDSYRSSSSHHGNTVDLREKFSSDAGDSRSLPKQSLSNQAGRRTSIPRKFQYHPMGNLDEDAEMPYTTRPDNNMHAMSVQHSRGLGQDYGNFGHAKIGAQVPRSSAEVGKGHVPDFRGIATGSDGMRFKGMIPGHMPNMFAPFDRSVGASTSDKASQPSQNMLELLHKVDQSREGGTERHFNTSEHNLSSEMPEPENSDGSLGGLQRSQSSNSQGFGLQLGPPSQRLPLPNNTSPSAVQAVNSNSLSQAQASPTLREKGHGESPPSHPFQEISHQEFKIDQSSSSGKTATETSVHKMMANFSSALGTGFPNSRSQLQSHQVISARGQAVTNRIGNESLNMHSSQIRQTDEALSRQLSSQSAEDCLPNKASSGLYDNAASSHDRVQGPQPSRVEKLSASMPRTNSVMSQHGAFSKTPPNIWTELPTQPHLVAGQDRKGHANSSHSRQLNILESTSLGMQNLEDQEAEKRSNFLSKLAASSSNLQDFEGARSKDSMSPSASSGKGDRAQITSGPLGKESITKTFPDESSVNPTANPRDFEAFGRSLKPNTYHQNYSLLNQMQAMKNTDIDPSDGVLKKLKGPDNFLGGQKVDLWSEEPNECNNVVGDASTCRTTGPPDDSQKLVFSEPAVNVEQNVPSQPANVTSKDMLAHGKNEYQNYTPSNSMASAKAQHPHISPQMAPSWFDQYETFKNGQTLPQRVDTVNPMEQPFRIGKLSGSLETHKSNKQVSPAENTSQGGIMRKILAPPSLATQQFSSPPLPPNVLRLKKRKRDTAELHSWLKEVSGVFENLQGICTVAVEWSRAANRLMEKVEDDGEVIEDVRTMPRPKRRLILTTLLMQQLFRPPPAVILCTDASSNYESVAYYAARLASGDACNLVSCTESYSTVSHSGANSHSDKSKQSARIDEHLSEVMEDFMSKARKLENDFLRLDKRASILDLRLECQELETFSTINRFARFHGRGQAEGPGASSSDAATNAPKPFPQRYVTAVAMPKNLPDRVQCLSL